MENITTKCCFKKTKLIWTILSIIVLFSLLITLGVFVFVYPATTEIRVEYIKGHNDILVQMYKKGDRVIFPDSPQKSGYKFTGWALGEGKTDILSQDIFANESLKFYAQWEEYCYTLVYNESEYVLKYTSQISEEDDDLVLKTGDNEIKISAETLSNKKFDSWIISDGCEDYFIEEFDFDNINSSTLILKPCYEDIYVKYNIIISSEYVLVNQKNRAQTIALGEELCFDVILDDCVDRSTPEFSITCGEIEYMKKDNVYTLLAKNFQGDFEINIDNISINKYSININNDGNILSLQQYHGEKLELSNLQKEGYVLSGVKDNFGRYYTQEFVICDDLELLCEWQIKTFEVKFPKGSGKFAIHYKGENVVSSKTYSINYDSQIEFSLTLSSAYSESNVNVYALSEGNRIIPKIVGSNYVFSGIVDNIEIFIDNLQINSYSVIVDGKNYGKFSYGSWISVDECCISINDSILNKSVTINTLINDKNFGGWIINQEMVLVNSIIQDIATKGEVNIEGQYSVKVARIEFVSNGGNLNMHEVVLKDGESLDYTPIKSGYEFVGWFTKLVEVNTEVDISLSVRFEEINSTHIIVYAGWKKIS